MSLAERKKHVESLPPRHLGPTCRYSILLSELPPKEAEALRWFVYESNLSERRVSLELAEEGIALHKSSVGNHRRGLCVTCKEA